jgi:hypothetical protein
MVWQQRRKYRFRRTPIKRIRLLAALIVMIGASVVSGVVGALCSDRNSDCFGHRLRHPQLRRMARLS